MPIAVNNATRVVDRFGKADKKAARTHGDSALAAGDILTPGTTVNTGSDAGVLLQLSGGAYLRIGANTVVVLTDLGNENGLSFKLLNGQVWGITGGQQLSPVPFTVTTPSSVTRVSQGLFGVGYELETDQSVVSVGDGSARVALASGGWEGTAKAGQFVRYLRRPQPNIRLRSPEIVAQDANQKTLWQQLRAESWTQLQGKKDLPPKLNRTLRPRLTATPTITDNKP